MNEGYLRPEEFLFSTATSVLIGLLLSAVARSRETQGGSSMVEIVGHSEPEFSVALDLMESALETGGRARVSMCTAALPPEETLTEVYLRMVAGGFHVSRPTARVVEGIPTTEFVLTRGSPAWPVLIPLIVPVLTLGLIAFGLVRIEAISRALLPLGIVTFAGLTILVVALSKPAIKYIEAGGRGPRLPA